MSLVMPIRWVLCPLGEPLYLLLNLEASAS
jgi:hypothetical protein